MIWQLINPSDPYTFLAPTVEIAAVAVAFLSTGFGAATLDGSQSTPILFGWGAWMKEHGIDEEWINKHEAEIADALDSMLIGDVADREDADEILTRLPADERQQWRASRQERRRTSINQIGQRAYKLAAHIRKCLSLGVPSISVPNESGRSTSTPAPHQTSRGARHSFTTPSRTTG